MNSVTQILPSQFLVKLLFAAALFCATFLLTPNASAQSNSLQTSSMTQNPQTSSGVATGLNEVLRWVFLGLKFLAVIAVAYGAYEMRKGEISAGVWSWVAALMLFFAPALVDLAQKIGQSTAQ